MVYPLVKFGADSFTIKGDTERDRQTQGDSNSPTGLRKNRLLVFLWPKGDTESDTDRHRGIAVELISSEKKTSSTYCTVTAVFI